MPHKVLRSLPPEREGSWPLILVTPSDRALPLSEDDQSRQRRLRQATYDLLACDLASAVLKGAALGFLFFLLGFGLLPSLGFWRVQWHWVWLLAGVLTMRILVGTLYTLLIGGLVIIVVGYASLISHWLFCLLFIGCGICLRTGYELLPMKPRESS